MGHGGARGVGGRNGAPATFFSAGKVNARLQVNAARSHGGPSAGLFGWTAAEPRHLRGPKDLFFQELQLPPRCALRPVTKGIEIGGSKAPARPIRWQPILAATSLSFLPSLHGLLHYPPRCLFCWLPMEHGERTAQATAPGPPRGNHPPRPVRPNPETAN